MHRLNRTYSPALKDQFYISIQNVIDSIPNTHAKLLIDDFNAECSTDSSIFPNVMGDFGYGKINDNSLRMLSFASTNNFILSDSWFRKKPRLRYTFFSNDGKTKKQLDHILISRRFRSMVEDVQVNYSADVLSDHRLVISKLRLHLKIQRSVKRKPKPNLSRLQTENGLHDSPLTIGLLLYQIFWKVMI